MRAWNRAAGSLAIVAALAGAGCIPGSKPTVITTPAGETFQAREARIWLYDLVNQLGGEIERSADEIRAASDDPSVRYNALRWKVETIPALHRAAFEPDPVMALADVWLLGWQLHDYFETGPGAELLGDHADSAVAAADRMVDEIVKFIEQLGGAPRERGTAQSVRDYARDHPIRLSINARPSVGPALADRIRTGKIGTFAAVNTMVEAFGDLGDRLTIYGEQLPRQARWEADLLLQEKGLERIDVDALLAEADRLGQLADRALELGEGLPELIDERVEANLPRIVETLEQVRPEAALDEVDAMASRQIAVALEAVGRERQLVLEAVRAERESTMNEAEQMAQRFLDESFARIDSKLDATLGRLLPLGLLLLTGPFLLGLLPGWVLRRRPAP